MSAYGCIVAACIVVVVVIAVMGISACMVSSKISRMEEEKWGKYEGQEERTLFGYPIVDADGLFPEDASIVLCDWKIYDKE